MPEKSLKPSCRDPVHHTVPRLQGLKPQAHNPKLEMMTHTASFREAGALVSTLGVYQAMQALQRPSPFTYSLFSLSSFPGHWGQLPLLSPLLHLRNGRKPPSVEGDSSKEQSWRPKSQPRDKSQPRTRTDNSCLWGLAEAQSRDGVP